MTQGAKALVCALACAGACLLLRQAAFAAPGGAAATTSAPRALRGAGAAAPHEAAGAGSSASPLSLGLAVGLAAGLAAVARRSAAPRRAFADGLVGSEYHGWGKYEWDPLELSTTYPEHLAWYREAELKHCRVAMLAFVGFIAPDGFRIPIPQLQDSSLDLINAHKKLIGPGLGEGPMWWLLAFCGVVESLRFSQLGLGFEKLTLENAGDLNFGKASAASRRR
ncbi:unnamed protein product [Prorocentrum cordatum]|uniref:Chlorophyll a-b binding protein, chloroplastic n=1 Tax=Prorocentrum cordatum TaxID=2364126 RepID=A0ABN9S5I1_9DINO|nr:unnamed protein product [Polarella glacialis]